jgi:beta-glucosidase-like glycosyl hydrolase
VEETFGEDPFLVSRMGLAVTRGLQGDALFGDVDPGGKLPISFARSAGHLPVYYNHKPSSAAATWATTLPRSTRSATA